jgi:hypothetical protein
MPSTIFRPPLIGQVQKKSEFLEVGISSSINNLPKLNRERGNNHHKTSTCGGENMTRYSTLHILQSTRNWIAEPSKFQKDLSSDITLEQHIPCSTNWLIIMQINCPQLGFFDASVVKLLILLSICPHSKQFMHTTQEHRAVQLSVYFCWNFRFQESNKIEVKISPYIFSALCTKFQMQQIHKSLIT